MRIATTVSVSLCEQMNYLTAFGELEAEISHAQASAESVAACQARPYKLRCNIRLSGVLINSFSITSSDVAVAPTAATCNEPSRSPAWRLFVSRDAYSSLKSPLCSCVFNHAARIIVNANHGIIG